MAGPAGIFGQLGFKSETTVGTPVTVDQFAPTLPGVRVAENIDNLESGAIRAGRRTTHMWKAGSKLYSGNIPLELYNQPLATLLTHMFGSVTTSGVGPYTHTATPGDLTGKSLTIQVGKPAIDGTVHPFTYAGAKVNEWEITANVGEIARLDLGVIGMTMTTGTALASASYAAGIEPFVFTEASLTIGGSSVATVKSATLSGSNNLTERVRAGAATSREPLENGPRTYSGEIVTDFEDLTHYNLFVNGTESALVLAFDNGTDSLTITCNVRFDGDTPELEEGLLEQVLPFKCVHATSDASAITAVLVNSESSAA